MTRFEVPSRPGPTSKAQPTVRVLVVDDSPVARQLVCAILEAEHGMAVVGTANDGEDAVMAVARLHPDVVTMDIQMPRLNGIEATRRLMREKPVPIVIVSATVGDEAKTSFDALEAGALALVPRPEAPTSKDFSSQCRELVEAVRLMAGVRVVRRRGAGRRYEAPPADNRRSARTGQIAAVGIGASTGGPPIVEKVLQELSPDFPAPVLVVQHMLADFVPGFVNWLNAHSALPVCVPADGDLLLPGRVYVAPGDRHLRVISGNRVSLGNDPPVSGCRPSASVLFESLARAYGQHAVGVLLSGMGRDGVDGFQALRTRGAITVAQDRESCVVWGMPGSAVAAGVVTQVLTPERITPLINRIARDGLAAGDDVNPKRGA